jgi:hypothetical protein
MMSRLFSLATLALVVGCTDAQVAAVQVDVGKVQVALNSACADVAQAEAMANAFGVAMIPQAATIEGFIGGSCVAGQATAALVAKAINDPATVAWTEGLATALKSTLKKVS